MRLDTLESGDRFTLPSLDKTGTLVSLGPMGARVRYGTSHIVVRERGTDATLAEFDAPGRVVTISAGTEVESTNDVENLL